MGGEIVSRECGLVGEGVCGIQMPEGKYLESVADGRAFARKTRMSADISRISADTLRGRPARYAGPYRERYAGLQRYGSDDIGGV